MLQRQILLKQLQELQRRQQLQGPGDARNQDYINHLLSLKQSSGNQFPPIVNRATVNDSQMMQRSGSNIFQGSPNGLVLSQSHNYALSPMALSMPQCDISLYGNTASNLHSPLQGPDNHSANLLAINSDNASGMYPTHPLGTDSSFMSHPGNYYSEQIGMPGDSFLTNEVCQDKNLFGQVPVHSLNRDLLLMDYSQQGIPLQRSTLIPESGERYGCTDSHGTPGQVSNVSQLNDSLDPLEQKIFNNSEYNSWASSFGSKKIETPSFESTVENPSYMVTSPSVQSGSWSALMQSAVAETSSSDTAMQEEWSGLSFQNPELSSDNQPLNFINSEIPQNNWIDRNMQNVPSACSNPDPLFQKSYDNYSLQSGFQIFKQKDEFQSEASNVSSQYSLRNTGNLVQTSITSSSRTWPAKCHESGGPTWIHGNTSDSVIGHTQKSFNQVNQMNGQGYSVESETMAFGTNVGHSEIMLELPNKNDVSNDHNSGMQLNSTVSSLNDLLPTDTSAEYFAKPHGSSTVSQGFGFKMMPAYAGAPQSNSFFPSLSMGSSHLSSIPSDYVNYSRMQHQALPVSSQLTTKFPEYSSSSSQVNFFQQKGTGTGAPEFPIVDKVVGAQSSGPSYVFQSASFPMGLSTPLPDNITCGDVVSQKPLSFSSNLLHSPGAFSRTLQNSSGVSPPSLIYPKGEHNVQAFGTYSGTSGSCEPQLEKRSSILESSHMSIPASMNRISRTILRNPSEADGFVSGVLTTCASQQPTKQSEQKDNEEPGFLPVGIKPVGQFLNQNLHSPRHFEVECSKRKLKYDNINHQQSIDSTGKLLVEQKLLLKDKAEYDEQQVQLWASPKGSGFLQEAQDNQLGKHEAAAPLDFQLMEKLSQSGTQAHSIGNKEASNLENQPQISLQMAPSWFKHYGTKNKDLLLPKSATNSAQPFSGLSIGDVQGRSLVMQLNRANTNQGSGSRSSSTAALIMNKNLPDAADITDQTSAVIKLKKRKLVAFDMVPWHKEVNCDGPKLQSVGVAELEWAKVSDRRQELTKNYAETIEDVPPVVQSKRRLTFTTQLMQQVFRPAPACILSTNASSNYNIFAYSTARLELGDACNLTSKLATSSNDLSFDKQRTSKRSVWNFSKVAEGLISRVKKLEGDLTRLDRSLSVVDIKVEGQDLEKFSTINCFAKFHIKAHPGMVDVASSSGQSAQQKAIPRPCVMGFPVPRILPEVSDCLSL